MSAAFNIYKNFIKNGFEHLGSGYYSAVFASKQDPNIVYKLGTRITDPCLLYLQANYNNKHFPKIHNLHIEKTYYIATMEHLTPLPVEKWHIADDIAEAVKFNIADRHDNELDVLVSKIQQLRDSNSSFEVDIHPKNVMLRNNIIPVITDPFSEEDIDEETDLETWESRYYDPVYSYM
jgi:hypothetical protein